MLPELTLGSALRALPMLQQAFAIAGQEMTSEANASKPLWKKTMSDLSVAATATEAYGVDHHKYPNVKSYGELQSVLSPTYIRQMPERDARGMPFVYIVSPDSHHYRFVSAGADGHFETSSARIETIPPGFRTKFTDNPGADIIFQDGIFVQAPVQSQKE